MKMLNMLKRKLMTSYCALKHPKTPLTKQQTVLHFAIIFTTGAILMVTSVSAMCIKLMFKNKEDLHPWDYRSIWSMEHSWYWDDERE